MTACNPWDLGSSAQLRATTAAFGHGRLSSVWSRAFRQVKLARQTRAWMWVSLQDQGWDTGRVLLITIVIRGGEAAEGHAG